MSQTWTDNVFQSDHAYDTDLQNMEDNFASLKSCFSGTAAPSNPVAGMFWYDTTNHILKIRNEANSAWINILDLSNEKAYKLGITISAGTGLSGGGELTADRTISHAAHTGDVTGDSALTIGNQVVKPQMLVDYMPLAFGPYDVYEVIGNSYKTLWKTSFYIPSGLSKIALRAFLNTDNPPCSVRFYIGGLYATAVSVSSGGYQWYDIGPLDVSSLTPGTAYELVIEGKSDISTSWTHMKGFSWYYKH